MRKTFEAKVRTRWRCHRHRRRRKQAGSEKLKGEVPERKCQRGGVENR